MQKFRAHSFILLFAVIALILPRAQAAVPLDALGQYLTTHGYGGCQFIHLRNTYRIPISCHGKAGDLTLDTGAPNAVIFKASMTKLGLQQTNTEIAVHGAFGKGRERLGITTIPSLTMGNCTLMNVKAAVLSDPASGGLYREYGLSDGLFGLREMLGFGAVLDVAHRLLFIHPGGSQKSISAGIKSILTAQGYTPVDLSVVRSHLQVKVEINGAASRLIVDTGAFVTMVDRQFARTARIGGMRLDSYVRGLGTSARPLSMAAFPIFKVGDFVIKNASVAVIDADPELLGHDTKSEAAGFLGAEYLGIHSAIFDFNNGTLYLRPAQAEH